MANTIEVKVPDIGDYDNVPVIEVLVKPGDTVAKDQGLITLESDKATMEVPAPFDGVVKQVKVKVGDEIGEGAVVALIQAQDAAAAASSPTAAGIRLPRRRLRVAPGKARRPPPRKRPRRKPLPPARQAA